MLNKDYIPRFFIYSAFILILISLLFPYAIIKDWRGSISYYYGYEVITIWFVLIMSAILIITYRHNSEFTKRMLFYPFIEYIILMFGMPLATIGFARVWLGFGYYLGLFGLLYQLIGIIITVVLSYIQSKGKTNASSDAPPPSSEQIR